MKPSPFRTHPPYTCMKRQGLLSKQLHVGVKQGRKSTVAHIPLQK